MLTFSCQIQFRNRTDLNCAYRNDLHQDLKLFIEPCMYYDKNRIVFTGVGKPDPEFIG
jgi:hypothetical protein